jgi:hypothetical protein
VDRRFFSVQPQLFLGRLSCSVVDIRACVGVWSRFPDRQAFERGGQVHFAAVGQLRSRDFCATSRISDSV